MPRASATASEPHPIHAMLAAFPLALFTAALATDIAYARTARMEWADFSVWMIAGGVAMSVVAAIAGIVDAMTSGRRRRRSGAVHGVLTVATVVVALVNGFVHSRDAWTSVVPTGLILSVITVVLVWVSSWQGYAMQTPRSGALA